MPTARPALSRQAIIDAAITLADEGGLEAVSMRAIGARLGVQAMSLYHHVANKGELLDGIHERLILSLSLDLATDTPWPEALRTAAHAYRGLALAHRQSFVLLATRPLATEAEIRHVLPLIELLGRAGFSPRQRLLVIEIWFTALNGILLAEVAPVPGHADAPEPDSAQVFLAAISEDRLIDDATAFAEHAAELGEELQIAQWFDTAVEVILAGLKNISPSRPE